MKIIYISASILPSETADSIHVMNMCSALSKNGNEVVLIGLHENKLDENKIFEYYGIEKTFSIITTKKGKIFIFDRLIKMLRLIRHYDIVYTRYTFAAWISSVIYNKKVIYEYHLMMQKIYNQFMEKNISRRDNVRHIFITKALREDYIKKYKDLIKKDTLILADCANNPGTDVIKNAYKEKLNCGYIGSFFSGKGIEVVLELSKIMPDINFHIVGGKEEEIIKLKEKYKNQNIIWHGYLKQKEALKILKEDIDIALLPNQNSVIIDNRNNTDIGKYTSPMKLFEYMSFAKAIVASDISVIKEVLNEKNSILLNPKNIEKWKNAIEMLNRDRNYYNSIRMKAYEDFYKNYTWEARAKNALSGIESIE